MTEQRRLEAKDGVGTPIYRQLDLFFRTAQYLDRHWLMSPTLNVYVRRNRRQIGQPYPVTSYHPTGKGWVEDDPILKIVDCLEIADIQNRGLKGTIKVQPGGTTEIVKDDTLAPFVNFIEYATANCPWPAIYTDNLGDSKIEQWCLQHGWWTLRHIDSKRSNGLFTWPEIRENIFL